MKKRCISLFLSLCILCSVVSAFAFTASAADGGDCGNSVDWTMPTWGGTLEVYGTGAMYDYSEFNPAPWAGMTDKITDIKIADTVTSIGDYAFKDCAAVTSVDIGAGVTRIGDYAFTGCDGLTKLTVPGQVKTVGSYAFADCSGLVEVILEPGVTVLDSAAFKGCEKLYDVSLPGTLSEIGSYAFAMCTSLGYMAVPGSVESVPQHMLLNCTALTSVAFCDGIKKIDPTALKGCSNLAHVDLPDTLESIDRGMFEGCSALTYLEIPASVKYINQYSFGGCTNLKYLHFLGDYPVDTPWWLTIPADLVLCYTEGAKGWDKVMNPTHKVNYYYMPGDEEEGGHVKKCDHCPYAVGEDHDFLNGNCQKCNAENPVKPTMVDVKLSHTVSFDADLQMSYRVKLENIAAAVENYVTEGAYLVVEKDCYPVGGGEKTVETVILYPDLVTDETRMLFNLPGIQSVEMGSELRAVLHFFDEEGTEYATAVDAYSVLAYAQSCFDYYDPAEKSELFTLLIDTLNYGAAAQLHFDRRADEPVNAGMEAYQKYATTELSAPLTDVRTYVENDRNMTAVTAMGFTVTFADKTEINAKLTVAEGYGKEEITAVKVLNEAGEEVAVLTEFTELDDGRLQVTFTGVKSVDMRNMYYFVAYVGEEIASQNVGYSIEAYAKSNIASADAKLADLALKCMYYGDSAYACFAEGVGN